MSKLRVAPQFAANLYEFTTGDLEELLPTIWSIIVLEQNVEEDFTCVEGRENYLDTLKLAALEIMYQQDAILCRRQVSASDHLLALVMEYGLTDLVDMEDVSICQYLFSQSFTKDDTDEESERMQALMRKIVEEFPGEIQHSLEKSSQRFFLKTLRNWSAISEAMDVDMAKLQRAIVQG